MNDDITERADTLVGSALPPFRAPSSHGQTLELDSFAGKVGLVVFVPADGELRDAELDEWDEQLVDFGHLRVQVLGIVHATAKRLRDESDEASRSLARTRRKPSGGSGPTS